uniref:Uncharacterized protein n=1 Tax=Oryza punctata TaxID=4537 RepID=A0A0E0JTD5_ORYPU
MADDPLLPPHRRQARSKKITELPRFGAHDGVVGSGNLLDFRARAQRDQITMQLLDVIPHGYQAHPLHRTIVGIAVPYEDQPLTCRSCSHHVKERSRVVLERVHLVDACWVDAGCGEVERCNPVPRRAEHGYHLVPAPCSVAKAVDKDEMLATAAAATLHFLLLWTEFISSLFGHLHTLEMA